MFYQQSRSPTFTLGLQRYQSNIIRTFSARFKFHADPTVFFDSFGLKFATGGKFEESEKPPKFGVPILRQSPDFRLANEDHENEETTDHIQPADDA